MDIDEKVSLSEYDDSWEAQFNTEKALLHNTFPDTFIEHVGSTSVNGMIAKPIIDIMLGVLTYPPSDDVVINLEKLGYYHFGEHNTTHAQLYFIKRGDLNYNVHVYEYEGKQWVDCILFRNYLRSHPDIASKYSEIKKRIIAKGKDTMLSYSYDKMDFIAKMIEDMNIQ